MQVNDVTDVKNSSENLSIPDSLTLLQTKLSKIEIDLKNEEHNLTKVEMQLYYCLEKNITSKNMNAQLKCEIQLLKMQKMLNKNQRTKVEKQWKIQYEKSQVLMKQKENQECNNDDLVAMKAVFYARKAQWDSDLANQQGISKDSIQLGEVQASIKELKTEINKLPYSLDLNADIRASKTLKSNLTEMLKTENNICIVDTSEIDTLRRDIETYKIRNEANIQHLQNKLRLLKNEKTA